jgi:hypothetical protein
MKKVLLLSMLSLALGAVAHAGFKSYAPVQVDLGRREAWGSLGDTRSTADANAFVSCRVAGSSTATTGNVLCEVSSPAGAWAYCFSSNPSIIAAAQALGPASYFFLRWDAFGTCTYLSVSNASSWKPMVP